MMRARQNGGLVYVRNAEGKIVSAYNAVRLTMELLRLGEQGFERRYGFSWTPAATTRAEAERRMQRAG